MKKICGIYLIKNNITGQIYIGQSRNINRRIGNHRCLNCREQQNIYKSILEYGRDNHSYEIICELPSYVEQEDLDSYEQMYIDYYTFVGFSLLNNKQAGWYGGHTLETRKKISSTLKGVKKPPRTAEHIRNNRDANRAARLKKKLCVTQ